MGNCASAPADKTVQPATQPDGKEQSSHTPKNTEGSSKEPSVAPAPAQAVPISASTSATVAPAPTVDAPNDVDAAKNSDTFFAGVMPDAKRGEMLRHVPIMRSLTEAQRDKLGGLMQQRQFAAGAMVFRKGDSPDGFYIIIEGSVRIIGENAGNQVTLASLRVGDYFGETALLNSDVRSASVLADADASCLFLQRDDFAAIFHAVDLSFAKRSGVTSDGASGQGAFHVPEKTPESSYKSQSVFAQLLKAFNHNPLLRQMSTEQKQALVEATHRITARPDDVVIAQGESGAHLFVIETGSLSVTKGDRAMGTMTSGTVFGELAILYNVPRAATVTATEECVLWVIDRFTFRKIARNIAESTIQQVVAFLAEVPLLRALSASEREKIAEAVEEKFVTAGETIVYEGEAGHCMYLLVRGHCQAVKRTASTAGGVVREYTQAGEFFGELALKGETEGKRQASVVAVQNTYLLTLGREAFKLLLGPLDQVISKAAEKYSDSGAAEELPRTGVAVDWAQLESLGTLGKGSFGHVQLVRERSTGTYYALKSVLKQQIVETQQQGHILSEKRVMERLQHPFLNTLHATFRSKNKLHLLLEPCLGGELFAVLRKRKLFPEEHAKFYAASVVLAFSYLHSKNTIYRDLKPENIMLTDQGYVKVADFGFAKCLDRSGKTWTLCGTPDYLAPEIVASRGHGKAVDWWTLGVLIFEMIASYPPFWDEDQVRTYNKILECNLRFPAHFSQTARELLNGLLERRATRRLGVGVTGVERLMQSTWFADFDWTALSNRSMPAPTDYAGKRNINTLPIDHPDRDPSTIYRDTGDEWDAEFGAIVGDNVEMASR